MVRGLAQDVANRDIGRQILRAGTGVGANYRSAGRARSHAEFTSRIGVVLEEADETLYWLELLRDCRILPEPRLRTLLSEATQLVAIFAAARKTALRRLREERARKEPRQKGRPAM
jgi:four helix bundle protein